MFMINVIMFSLSAVMFVHDKRYSFFVLAVIFMINVNRFSVSAVMFVIKVILFSVSLLCL